MDIDYLLWLQGIRETLPPVVEDFFVVVSAIAANTALVIIPCVLYWCLDKRAGVYVMFSYSMGTLLNQFMKNTVCCYRPWMRDAAVHPAEAALPQATGYSFPSGHTQGATSLVGSLGWYYRKRWRALLVGCALFALLVAFSRNFLGVHTPQDVLAGLVEGVLMLLAVERLLAWIDEAPERDVRVLVVSMIVLVGYVAYIYLKPYPMDYDAAGNLLVDPVVMQVDCFKAAGLFAGVVLGWFCERRFVAFEAGFKRLGWKGVALRMGVGLAVLAVFFLVPSLLLKPVLDERWYELVKNAVAIFGAIFVAPAAFSAVERRKA